ncbi:hypothetical protein V8G54_025864 [Vigna mungo]|uniref:Tf2-1-like SH3-like domain-containing protein n=1 Tax=Vigna mungo TaxID=3915 RepID=A0AAQ3MZR8_VIGMU
MKKWADTNRKDIQFSVGDYVYVRLRPCKQASVVGPYISKLQKCFFGAFKITNKLGTVAYALELPPCARIHNVFHISFLRPHKGPLPNSPLQLPPEIDEHQPILEPTAILDWKWDNSTPDPQIQVLIQWLGLPLEEATWEAWQVIKSQFHLEDKVILEPREMTSKRQPQPPQRFKDYVVTCPMHILWIFFSPFDALSKMSYLFSDSSNIWILALILWKILRQLLGPFEDP